MKKAVHFGAGNIGRGFVGLILHDAGYEVVFADVNAELIDALDAASSYEVHEVGDAPATRIVDHFRAFNSATQEEELRAELTTAHIVTTAVGPTILRFIAPHIAAAMRERPAELPPLQVMACENAINATDLLRDEVASFMGQDEWRRCLHRAVFANTAVDRIVPGQDPDAGLDVTVESFFEWVIEERPFEGDVPDIPDATFVADLLPFIERKLFTVNTGHATVAYLGAAAGYTKLSDALGDPSVAEIATRVLQETSTLLVAKHRSTPRCNGTTARRSCAGSRIRRCPTPFSGSAASPCANSADTSASSDLRPNWLNAVCPRARWSRRSAPCWRSTSQTTSRACRCTSFSRQRRARGRSSSR